MPARNLILLTMLFVALSPMEAPAFAASSIGQIQEWSNPINQALGKTAGSSPDSFVAIGWSTQGDFAAIESLDPGMAAPMIFLRLIVFDSVEDQLEYDQTVQWDPENGDSVPGIIASREFQGFLAAMDRLEVDSDISRLPSLRAFPLLWQGIRFQPIVQTKVTDKDGDGFSPFIDWNLSIQAEQAGKKAIKRISGEKGIPAMSISVDGLCQSPTEARIIVLIRVHRRVLEGDEMVRTVLSGCALNKRFDLK